MKTFRLLINLIAFGLLVATVVPAANAAPFPERPITFIVPYAAGGGTDVIARAVGKAMGDSLGQPVVVENRPGGSGMIGANVAARAAPNGYTLVMTTSSLIIQTLKPSPSQGAVLESFQPIGVIATAPMALSVAMNVPVSSLGEFVTYARANPNKLNYATFGKGTAPHLVTESMDAQLGIKMVDIPYQGAAPASLDLLRGEVQVFCDILATAFPLAKEGRTKMLALMAPKRSSFAPNVPTFAELGFPNVKAEVLVGISAPAGTPKPIVAQLQAALSAALKSETVLDGIKAQSFEASTPEESADFANLMNAEREKWRQLIQAINLKIE